MESVFDWVGSLSLEPEFFSLRFLYGPPLAAEQLVSIADRQILSMVETTILNELGEEGHTTFDAERQRPDEIAGR